MSKHTLVEALEAMFNAFEGAVCGDKAEALHKASQALDLAKDEQAVKHFISHPTARSNQACGRAIQQMADAIGNYCLEYKGVTDSVIGDDYVLGPEAKAILSALRGLLDGPTGDLDCGKVDNRLLEIAQLHGLADEDREV